MVLAKGKSISIFAEPFYNYTEYRAEGEVNGENQEYLLKGPSIGLKVGFIVKNLILLGVHGDFTEKSRMKLFVDDKKTDILEKYYFNRENLGAFFGILLTDKLRLIGTYNFSSEYDLVNELTNEKLEISYQSYGASLGLRVAKRIYLNFSYLQLSEETKVFSKDFSSVTYSAGASFFFDL